MLGLKLIHISERIPGSCYGCWLVGPRRTKISLWGDPQTLRCIHIKTETKVAGILSTIFYMYFLRWILLCLIQIYPKVCWGGSFDNKVTLFLAMVCCRQLFAYNCIGLFSTGLTRSRWQIGPFWQDTLEVVFVMSCPVYTSNPNPTIQI